jgi:hypothetical protein
MAFALCCLFWAMAPAYSFVLSVNAVVIRRNSSSESLLSECVRYWMIAMGCGGYDLPRLVLFVPPTRLQLPRTEPNEADE